MAVRGHLDRTAVGHGQEPGQARDQRLRLQLETSGALPSGEQANVMVHNISPSGMLLETSLPLAEGESLSVALPEGGAAIAQVVWASGMLFGCRFEERLSPGMLSAARLRATAPLPPEIGLPAPQRQAHGDLFGKRIEKLRKLRGLTLSQVATALGVSKPTVWAWEKGKARPIEERLPALARTLGIGSDELVTLSEPPGMAEVLRSSRQQIAEAYGTTPDRVRIMIEL